MNEREGGPVKIVTALYDPENYTLQAVTEDGRIFQWTGHTWAMVPGSDSLNIPARTHPHEKGRRQW